jgi:hypothetical protein
VQKQTAALRNFGWTYVGSGSRLQQISQILQVPVAFFFEDAPGASETSKSDESVLSLAHVDDFVSSSDGLRLIAAFTRIESVTLRRRITSLVQEMADWNGDPVRSPKK